MKSRQTGDQILHLAAWFTAAALGALTLVLAGRLSMAGIDTIAETLQGGAFWGALAVGLAAQLVDGMLGMGYGVTAASFLLTMGASPAVASASVHIAKFFTCGVSGMAHAKYGNVERRLFVRLLVPGALGAVAGVALVTHVDAGAMRPYVAAYLLLMGCTILAKALFALRGRRQGEPRHVGKLALFGGFVDAIGGGGWGPVVTSTLVGSGNDPRTTVGSVNFAEFFVTLATATSFTLLAVEGTWPVVAGLVAGGVLAAPFAARLCRGVRPRLLLALVGLLITALSLYSLYRALA